MFLYDGCLESVYDMTVLFSVILLALKSEETLLQIRLEYARWSISVMIPDFNELPIRLEKVRNNRVLL